jgi:hypothetical protein
MDFDKRLIKSKLLADYFKRKTPRQNTGLFTKRAHLVKTASGLKFRKRFQKKFSGQKKPVKKLAGQAFTLEFFFDNFFYLFCGILLVISGTKALSNK